MKLAALAGISVAATQVVRLSGLHAVAIRRFDRTVGGGRIHSVSASTAIRAATAAGQEPQLIKLKRLQMTGFRITTSSDRMSP
jgi:serine/threonine-protein kinase HipA